MAVVFVYRQCVNATGPRYGDIGMQEKKESKRCRVSPTGRSAALCGVEGEGKSGKG